MVARKRGTKSCMLFSRLMCVITWCALTAELEMAVLSCIQFWMVVSFTSCRKQ